MEHQSIAKRSANADILISEISRKNKGDLITWDWMTSIIGKDPRSLMGTVKNRLIRDYSYVLSSQPGIGYRICDDALVVEGELSKDRKHRRKSAIRSKVKAQAVDMGKLSESQQLKCLGEIASAHVVAETSTTKAQEKIVSGLGGETKPLALNKALEALMNNGN